MENNNPSDKLDVRDLLVTLWHNKLMFVLAFLLSLVISSLIIYNSEPQYVSHSLINERKQDNKIDSILPERNSLSQLLGGESESSVPPIILGREFLFSLIKTYNLLERLKEVDSCAVGDPSFYSLTGILKHIGVINRPSLDDAQILEGKIDCVRKMISLQKFVHEQLTTTAIIVSVTHHDPFFAAELCNKVVEHYFDRGLKSERLVYEKTLNFMAEAIAKYTKEFEDSKEEVRRFLLKHPTAETLNISLSPDNVSQYANIFVELENLRKKRQELEEALIKLSDLDFNNLLNQKDEYNLPREPYSRNFLVAINKVLIDGEAEKDKREALSDLIRNERTAISSMLNSTIENISTKESELQEVYSVSMKFSELKADMNFKKILREGINQKFQNQTFLSSSLEIIDDKIFSKAVAPNKPISPQPKIIFVLTALLSLLITGIIVLIRQSLNVKIYSLTQLEEIASDYNIIPEKNSKMARLAGLIKDDKISAYRHDLENLNLPASKGVGVVFDMSNRSFFEPNNLFKVQMVVSHALRLFGKDIICFNKYLKLKKDKQISKIDNNDFTQISAKNESLKQGSIVISNASYGDNEFFNFDFNEEKKDSNFLIAYDYSISYSSRLKLAQKSDFFVLALRKGKSNLRVLQRFASDISFQKEKCIGILFLK